MVVYSLIFSSRDSLVKFTGMLGPCAGQRNHEDGSVVCWEWCSKAARRRRMLGAVDAAFNASHSESEATPCPCSRKAGCCLLVGGLLVGGE